MPEITEHAPGVPCWTDLATPDPGAAKDFYATLFGWEYREEPTDEGPPYVMALKNGKSVAGIMQQDPQQAEQGIPPMWNTYVSVRDADVTVGLVAEAGGSVIAPPFDVMGAGRMAVLADPTGGVLSVWQKRNHIGAELVNEHGAMTWNELITADVERASAFYEHVFGWKAQTGDIGIGGGTYTGFYVDGAPVGGAMAPPMPEMPTAWFVYFAVDDTDATVDTATGLGATVAAEPMDIEPGRMASFLDPRGALVSVIALAQPAGD